MYASQAQFDAQVSGSISSNTEILIAMPQAALRSFKKFRGLKVLHVVNGHPLEHNRLVKSSKLNPLLAELVPKRVVKRVAKEFDLADLILVPSRTVRNGLISHGVEKDKIFIIPYGVDKALFKKSPDNIVKAYDIGFVGQISIRKGVNLLIETARNLPNYSFVLAGPIVDYRLIRKLPPNIQYVGMRNREEVRNLLEDCEVIVLPSYEDAYPLVALEAYSSGAKLVASESIGTFDLLQNAPQAHFFEMGNLEDFKREILLALMESSSISASKFNIKSWNEYGEEVLGLVLKYKPS